MPTELEELQAKEFLKRAEIKTMKKDLRALREVDALKERDKIVKIKTLEEQRLEHEKKLREQEQTKLESEKTQREKVLGENASQERLAEKDLKQYATEQERQQIFLFEAQRLAFNKKIEEINSKKDPALKLEKNKILIDKRSWEEKLNAILEQEKKLEEEQTFISQKSQVTTIPSEKKSLEERRWDIEKEIQEIEKKRWVIEKEIENQKTKISQVDESSKILTVEKNDLDQKILGIDKSLRDIYSDVITRVQEQRKGKLEEQKATREALAKSRLAQKEEVQRQQWKPSVPVKNKDQKEKFINTIPVPGAVPVKKAVKGPSEEEQRKSFMENVENWAKEKDQQKQSTPANNLVPPKKNTNN